MKVRVRLFASLREMAEQGEFEVEVPEGTTAQELWSILVSDLPKLGDYTGTVQVAINHEFSDHLAELHQDDEVAFLPPVSGG